MATIADELLNDFEDSGDENEEEHVDDQYFGDSADAPKSSTGASGATQSSGMELDGDEEEPDDEGSDIPDHVKKEAEETPEETKARVESMQLHNVADVRSVAGLMKQLDPLLEVSTHFPILHIMRRR